MEQHLFEQLMRSVAQAGEIARGERKPSRVFEATTESDSAN